ncbi:type VI secretion system baseplate subunit TssG [Pandoraea communis]|uniref:type VI secretion system baseplate subunit TssG n=1 Tax=Pandoraea communis TaxID=2508297 RepID=UPI0025A4EAFC|nr:type VI secretion system baseplate subunit TssG [Pandoraea communis]MDM8359323.1 type VI secretion system baseplate subunit TssG [Pandoraea communis]
MTARDIPDLDPLVQDLLARAPHMSFMQLCRLLELRAPDMPGLGTRNSPAHEAVRFRPWPRMGFPTAEVVRVERDEDLPDAPPTLRTTFMGLYGVDAPTPSHMVDDIALREEGHEPVAAFLDQFNHRVVTLLYRAWKKYRYPESFRAGGDDEHSRSLLCLAGFANGDKPQRAGLPGVRMLAILGLMVQRTRTAEGLASTIAVVTPGVDVKVEEFYAKTISAGVPRPLTSAASTTTRGLGAGYVLGRRLAYRHGAVEALLHPTDAAQVGALLPGTQSNAELMAMIALYMGNTADVYVRLVMPSTMAPQPSIGVTNSAHAPRLGWTCVLPSNESRNIRITLGVHRAIPTPEPNPCLSATIA